MKIKVLDAVHSQILDRGDISLIAPVLSYTDAYWKQGQYRRERIEYTKQMISRSGLFLTGHLQRVKNFCEKNNLPLEITGQREKLQTQKSPFAQIVPREDQTSLIEAAIKEQRGVLIAPTGSGKTYVLASLIISRFTNTRALFLCHTLDLVSQTAQDFKSIGFPNVAVMTGKQKETGIVTVATRQTFIRNLHLAGAYDIVLVDETHHASSPEYQKILTHMPAPVRIGFTATMPKSDKEILIIEGLLGPIIGETTLTQGIEEGFLSVPYITLIDVPESTCTETAYNKIYEQYIVKNKRRNHIIIKEAAKRVKEGKSVLIFVSKLEHGDNLMEISALHNLECIYLRGETESDIRNDVRTELNNKNCMCVIATTIWKEGVNIPSLDCIFIAGADKTNTGVLQNIGRGLRTTKEKDTVEIVDFIDKGKYISDHLAHRLAIYANNGWI